MNFNFKQFVKSTTAQNIYGITDVTFDLVLYLMLLEILISTTLYLTN